MLLTLSTTHSPATDLGYLLHKSPFRPQSFELAFGQAHVFYPEASEERTTAALLLEVDPVALVRNRRGLAGEGGALEQYVNDRPYVASSFMSVALARVFRSAMSGASKERPELAEQSLPLVARLSVLPCRGGEAFLRRLFEPLGYGVTATRHALDETVPEWGGSRYYTVTLEARTRLSDLLTHLYVLIPVLDDDKHYWVGDEEVEKLLRHGEGWLAAHPERELITRRYLRHQKSLAREALERLAGDEAPEPEERARVHNDEEATLESRLSLNEQRLQAVVGVLKECGAARVVDLGCGEGKLLKALLKERQFSEILGMDVSVRSLEIARERLDLDRMSEMQRRRVNLLHGSLMYRDKRLAGFEAATVIEVVEHLDPPRLAAFERVLFECARPNVVVLTTPNAEYNTRFESLPAGTFRHRDHRFEWTRAEFEAWARKQCERFGYSVRFLPVGPVDGEVGAPTQMAVFSR
ncbi:3' terminal RNA ribose 2'-O-methyltransferase Hen1 [Pyxidicoccus fallax]|uniref:Small RNA 2'-O-methyltransferase n=1 Tax=Pyxidicoccus fallax TaxID=394095 RepID=A0A848L607_9BACT|nr:3' terminal RNA ribose 2'-O-methyltransferase Hen1 [Pyxidicoccus fallax]NMO14046.1 3' terminal RNA ribose 2'-O-methyltransferase Hen1 [Pyxidicoccus fallax]NPC82237.1 3' terminal RNA ribose 2'-O-methyltransferase Hen1 [Pyxidicoccus fallax]